VPALPLDEAGKYVAAAYLVFLALILIYVAIMAVRLARIQQDIAELAELVDGREPELPAPGAAAARPVPEESARS
jgi:hypothetical protein